MKRVRGSDDIITTRVERKMSSYMDLVADIRRVIANILFDGQNYISLLGLSLINKQSYTELSIFNLNAINLEISIGKFANLEIAKWYCAYNSRRDISSCLTNIFKGYIISGNDGFCNILSKQKSEIQLNIGCYFCIINDTDLSRILAFSPHVTIINKYSYLLATRDFLTFYELICKLDNVNFVKDNMSNYKIRENELINANKEHCFSDDFNKVFLSYNIAAIDYLLKLPIKFNAVSIVKYLIFDSFYGNYYKDKLLNGDRTLLCEIANNKNLTAIIMVILKPLNIDPIIVIKEMFKHNNIPILNYCVKVYDKNIIINSFTKSYLISLVKYLSTNHITCHYLYKVVNELFNNLTNYDHDFFEGIYKQIIEYLLIYNFDTAVIILQKTVGKKIDWSRGDLLSLIENLQWHKNIQLLINWMHKYDSANLFRYFTINFITNYLETYKIHDDCSNCLISDEFYNHNKYCALLWIKETLLPIAKKLKIKKDNCQYLKRWIHKQFFYNKHKLYMAMNLVEIYLE